MQFRQDITLQRDHGIIECDPMDQIGFTQERMGAG